MTGKFSKDTKFEKGDHRFFNREGQFFDKGETFSGIPYEVGIEAVEKLRSVIPVEMELSDAALKWILMKPEVSCIIPGASKIEHVHSNCMPSEMPNLDSTTLEKIDQIYSESIKEMVHQKW